jgi:hypothetical protein
LVEAVASEVPWYSLYFDKSGDIVQPLRDL